MGTQSIDYYELLQISPHADADTIHRVYRFLAARLHPDHSGSGDAENFRLLKRAYDVLSDPKQRADYDANRGPVSLQPPSASADFMDALDGELNRRLAVLALLYHRRRTNPAYPEVALVEVEERMGFPRDYLDFTLWYLSAKGYIAKADNAKCTLTADGVDFVETQHAKIPIVNKLLSNGSGAAITETERANGRPEAAPAPHVPEATVRPTSDPGLIVLPSEPLSDQHVGNPDQHGEPADFRADKVEWPANIRNR